MKTSLLRILTATILFLGAARLGAQTSEPYLTIDDMPDLVKCLPPPPDSTSTAFAIDVMRYMWGKAQRLDPERAAQARRDAIWDLDTLFTCFHEPLGLEISPEKTPEIYQLLWRGISTIELIRVRPKATYMRIRPFVMFNEHLLNTDEEFLLRYEGSYPSGHTIRGWGMALILTEINPAAAEALFKRAWIYGENRVIDGAHWQSDVDASRDAAAIAYAKLQTCPAYREQVARAKAEFKRLTRK